MLTDLQGLDGETLSPFILKCIHACGVAIVDGKGAALLLLFATLTIAISSINQDENGFMASGSPHHLLTAL